MKPPSIETQIAEINLKLDFITEKLHEQEQKRREMQELKDELVFIGKDIFQATASSLEEVAPYFDTDDLLRIVKLLLRNTRNIATLLTQIQSAADLLNDAKMPLRGAFTQSLETLDELDRKGYFVFMKEAAQIVDTIVTSFSVDDVRLLRENVVTILNTFKEMTQPEMMTTINTAMSFFRNMDITVGKDASYWQIFGELRKPEVKQGIVYLLEFVQNMAQSTGSEHMMKNKENAK